MIADARCRCWMLQQVAEKWAVKEEKKGLARLLTYVVAVRYYTIVDCYLWLVGSSLMVFSPHATSP